METDQGTTQGFKRLVDTGMPVGEIVGVTGFLLKVRGLQPISPYTVVILEDGSRGYVHHILEDSLLVLHLGTTLAREGMLMVSQGKSLSANVGRDFIGRIISATGVPLDGKGPIAPDSDWPVFHQAPPIYEREFLDTQLETGVTMIDALFPIVRGQRLAMLGDTKSGKSILATQIAINQKNTDQICVYVVVAKRRSDVDALITRLTESGALAKAIVVVSNIFDSLVTSYLAPYIGCAMGEYLWQKLGQDTVVIYDDLTTHAYACREIALLSGSSPGRDSYPGDIFYSHSSLLERAGKLKRNNKCQTAIPLVLADGGDITAYLPTNIMSITDGQWIIDMELFRASLRPAISRGLSVTRVGGVGHNDRQKKQNAELFKILADFDQAEQFAHFGTEMAASSQMALTRGHKIREYFTQKPNEVIRLLAQQLAIDVLLDDVDVNSMDINQLKQLTNQGAQQIKTDADYEKILANIKSNFKPAPAPPAEQNETAKQTSANTGQPTNHPSQPQAPAAQTQETAKK